MLFAADEPTYVDIVFLYEIEKAVVVVPMRLSAFVALICVKHYSKHFSSFFLAECTGQGEMPLSLFVNRNCDGHEVPLLRCVVASGGRVRPQRSAAMR